MSAGGSFGAPRGERGTRAMRIARIDGERCIGCTRCIEACPFDAIIGARRRMHTVIDALCIGCDLCVAPCPVDCITMIAVQPERRLSREESLAARARRDARQARQARQAQPTHESAPPSAAGQRKREIIDAALRRARKHGALRSEPPESAR